MSFSHHSQNSQAVINLPIVRLSPTSLQSLRRTSMLVQFSLLMLLINVFRGQALRPTAVGRLHLPSKSFYRISPSVQQLVTPFRLHSSAFGGAAGDSALTPDNSAAQKSSKPFGAPKGAADDSSFDVSSSKGGWASLGLMDELKLGLDRANLSSPTPIQELAIPALLSSNSVAFAAATGSGKTLAYLLPVMQKLKGEELLMGSSSSSLTEASSRKVRRPRAVIMAPTRELASQILSVLKDLSHTCKLSSVGIIGGDDMGKQRRSLDKCVDIVVGTPGRILKHRNDGNVFLGSVSTFVIDETDTMLEQGFQGDIAELLHPCLYRGDEDKEKRECRESAPQVVLTTATMTQAVRRLLNGEESNKVAKARERGQEVEGGGPTIALPKTMRVLEAAGEPFSQYGLLGVVPSTLFCASTPNPPPLSLQVSIAPSLGSVKYSSTSVQPTSSPS